MLSFAQPASLWRSIRLPVRSTVRCCSATAVRNNSSGQDVRVYLDHQLGPKLGLSTHQNDALLALTDLVLDANQRQNLTAIKTKGDIINKHIVDALTLLPVLEREEPSSIIDIGTGAGFPGLVLAIVRPEYSLTLLDSVRKKTEFIKFAARELSLNNVQTIWGRAEDIGQAGEFREHFSVSVARSVAEMRVLSELCLPFVRRDGCFLAQKSVHHDLQEIESSRNSIRQCGGELEGIPEAWPGDWGVAPEFYRADPVSGRKKAIVVVRKKNVTPQRYPRKPGVPKKNPL